MKSYTITRDPQGHVQCLVRDNSKSYPLTHKVHHSPTGFEVGYGGSGPSDLALSILADAFSNQEHKIKMLHGTVVPWAASMFYQDFKWDFLTQENLHGGIKQLVVTYDAIKDWLTEKLKAKNESS